MALTPADRERILDSKRKLESAAHTLKHVGKKKIPDFESIEECLEDADRTLDGTLRSDSIK